MRSSGFRSDQDLVVLPISSQSSVFGARPPVRPSHSLWKSQPSSRWRYVARTSRYNGASSDSSPGNRTGVSLTSSCSRGPRWQSYRTKRRLAAYGTIWLVRKLLPVKHDRYRTEKTTVASSSPIGRRDGGGASYCAVSGSCWQWVESCPCRVPAGRGGVGASQRDPPGWRPALGMPQWP